MDEIILSDNMKKEGKRNLVFMIQFIVVALMLLIGGIYLEFPINKLILVVTTIVLFACILFYNFLYGMRYDLTVTKEEIRFKTLFRTVIIQLSDIKEYTYKQYMRSVFYQFKLRYLNKKIVISTRYREEFDQILKAEMNGRK